MPSFEIAVKKKSSVLSTALVQDLGVAQGHLGCSTSSRTFAVAQANKLADAFHLETDSEAAVLGDRGLSVGQTIRLVSHCLVDIDNALPE